MTPSPDPGMAQRPGTPRWVIALGVGLAALILLAVVLMVMGDDQHGPGRHTEAGGGGGSASPTSAVTAGTVGERADKGIRGRIIVG